MRALIRASSSASSTFFFLNASRACCCALLTEPDDVAGFCSRVDVAFCLPLAFAEGIGATAGAGIADSESPYGSSSTWLSVVFSVGIGVIACDGDVAAVLEPGMGLAPSTCLMELMKLFLVTSLFSCNWS